MKHRLLITILVTAALTASSTVALAEKGGRKKGHWKKSHREAYWFSPERPIGSHWFYGSGLPPGLAKRDRLPPGLEKHLRERGSLPPGLQKRVSPQPFILGGGIPQVTRGRRRGWYRYNGAFEDDGDVALFHFLRGIIP